MSVAPVSVGGREGLLHSQMKRGLLLGKKDPIGQPLV